MGQITVDLDHALDVADAWLKGGDPHAIARRVEEARDVLSAVVAAVRALDARLDSITQ